MNLFSEASVTYSGGRYIIHCPFDWNSQLKSDGWSWDARAKLWITTGHEVAKKYMEFADTEARAQIEKGVKFMNDSYRLSRAIESNFEVQYKERKPFSFQRAGVAYIVSRRNTLLADDMGSGKSAMSIMALNHIRPKTCLIVCPKSLKLNWFKELGMWLAGNKMIDILKDRWRPYTEIGIIHYDALHKLEEDIKAMTWDMLICDEAHVCFPWHTLVTTNIGDIPIEDIVDHGKATHVLSFNFLKKKNEWRQITHKFNNPTTELIKIKHTFGEIICTANHKIYTTNGGYKKAIHLSSGDILQVLRKEVYEEKVRKGDCEILFAKLCGEGQVLVDGGERKAINKTTRALQEVGISGNEKLRMVQGGVRIACESETDVLLNFLFSKTKGKFTRSKGGVFQKVSPQGHGIEAREQRSGSRRENENKECRSSIQRKVSNCKCKKKGKEFHWTKGRKWVFDKTSEATSKGNLSLQIYGTQYPNKRSVGSIRKYAERIFSRYCNTEEKDSNRSRWEESQQQEVEIFRQEEDRDFKLSRVESVEVQERGGSSGCSQMRNGNSGCLYDIEVDYNHNYYANGVLVSNCRNSSTKRSKLVTSIRAERKLYLTGTPIVNRPKELWALIHSLDPGRWSNFIHFAERYCKDEADEDYRPFKKKFGQYNGAANLEELQNILRGTIMIRRLKAQILPQLPKKIRQIVELEPEGNIAKAIAEGVKEYKRIEEKVESLTAIVEKLKRGGDEDAYRGAVMSLKDAQLEQFSVLARQRVESARMKLPYVIQYLEELLEDTDEKFIVFGHHKEMLGALYEKFETVSVRITGDVTSDQKRQDAVDRFQTDPSVRFFFGQFVAAGVGITLTASSNVIFAEMDWVPGNISQCEDRANRIGAVHTTFIMHIVLQGSIDAYIMKRVVEKQEVIERAMDLEAKKS